MTDQQTDEFHHLADFVGQSCTWRIETPLRPRYVLLAGPRRVPVMELRKRYSWVSNPVHFGWKGFSGIRTVEQVGNARFPYFGFLSALLFLPSPRDYRFITKDIRGNVVAVETVDNKSRAYEITTEDGVYDMRLRAGGWTWKKPRTLVVSDEKGDIVISNWFERDIRLVRLEENGPLLLALAWRHTLVFSDI